MWQHPTLRKSRRVGAPGLAVDMLEHSSHKNMDNALLVAGDEDFTPLVESVVRLGTWVEVYYDPRSAAEELYAAADRGIPMKFDMYYRWSKDEFKKRCVVPQHVPGVSTTATQFGRVVKEGTTPKGEYVALGCSCQWARRTRSSARAAP